MGETIEALEPVEWTPAGCVYELAIVEFERRAWIEDVIGNPDGPDLDRYIAPPLRRPRLGRGLDRPRLRGEHLLAQVAHLGVVEQRERAVAGGDALARAVGARQRVGEP